jgi:tetratricopeptide (TPR) repeat protein
MGNRMRATTIAFFAVATLALPADAIAATEQDQQDCAAFEGSPDRAIAGCTRIIDDKDRGPQARVEALSNRGEAYEAKGDFAKALADYSTAIELDTEDYFLRLNRGEAYAALGDHDKAIADFSEAIRLAPENGTPFPPVQTPMWRKTTMTVLSRTIATSSG